MPASCRAIAPETAPSDDRSSAFERTIGNATRVVISIAQHPRLANWSVTRHGAASRSASRRRPEPVLVDWLEPQGYRAVCVGSRGLMVVLSVSIAALYSPGARPGCSWLDGTGLLGGGTLAASPRRSPTRVAGWRGQRERQPPGQVRLEPDVHGIQARGGQLAGLTPERNTIPGTAAGTPEGPSRCVGHLVHGCLCAAGEPRNNHVGLEDHAFGRHRWRYS